MVRHCYPDQHGIVPCHLGHRLWKFLQPAVVGETAVPNRRIPAEVDLGGMGIDFGWSRSGERFQRNLLGLESSTRNPPVVQRTPPEHLEVATGVLHLPILAYQFIARRFA